MVLALALFLSAAASEADRRCSVARPGDIYVREQSETWATGEVLPHTRRTSMLPPKVRHFKEAEGHVVRFDAVPGYGVGSAIVPGDSAVVFLWVITADCTWAPAGNVLPDSTRHHFAMLLRPDSQWVDDLPTFDVVPEEGCTVYPGSTERPPLTVDQFANFASLIPTRSEWSEDCRPGVRRANEWLRRHLQPGNVVAFPNVIQALVAACEYQIANAARSFVRPGPSDLPEPLRAWSARSGCYVKLPEHDPGSANAVSGRFIPDEGPDQWALICTAGDRWRLLIVDPLQDAVLAELGSFVGSDEYWSVEAAASEYFFWVPIGNDEPVASVPPPTTDTILLNGEYLIYWSDGRWVFRANRCCGFNH